MTRASERLFAAAFATLAALAVVPFWLTRILPMQDYPQILLFARAFGDCHDPASPFHGAYTTGFPLAPLLLPILLLRALAALSSFETAGRLLWSLYAVGLPLASLHLLRVLGRDPWAALLVFPLVFSYWVGGGFFAFATAAPLLVLGLAASVRWLAGPTWRRGAWLAAILCALHLWHSLAFAQLLLDFGVLWLLAALDRRARLVALLPTLPSLALFALWMRLNVVSHPPGSQPPQWPPFVDNVTHFFDYVGPVVPGAVTLATLLGVLLSAAAFAAPAPQPQPRGFRVATPFAWLALVSLAGYVLLPASCFGVDGIQNRQPWTAALLLVFGYRLPASPRIRTAFLSLVAALGAFALLSTASRYAAFSRESEGASRLVDLLHPGDTLLAPLAQLSTASFPAPAKPFRAMSLYGPIRAGGVPDASFAGYAYNLVRYVDGKNPMPDLRGNWIAHPELKRYDYVLLRGTPWGAEDKPNVVRRVAKDGEWSLWKVCGSRATPVCG